ncbi:GtrA family protein [Pseudoxanthomonas beigongshangi]
MSLLKQAPRYVTAGILQLLLDWLMFVALTSVGVPAAPSNLAGRVSGALLGFWINGRWTFAQEGRPKLGWRRLLRFMVVWLTLTLISTWLVAAIAASLGLKQAWLAKPLVEGGLAVVAFFLWRYVVYR